MATAYHPFWVVQGEDLESRTALRHVEVSEDRGRSLPGRWKTPTTCGKGMWSSCGAAG